MKKKLCALLLVLGLLSSAALGANAAGTELAPVEASLDIGVVAADYPEVGSELEPETELPSSFSNRELATPVRNQRLNTCWAYSSTGVMEIVANKNGIFDGQFSPMHMNYWATKREDGSGWQRAYSDAGYPYIAMGYLMSGFGAVTEDEFPYTSELSDYQDHGKDITPTVSAGSLVYLKGGDIDTVKTAVYHYGAAVGNFHYTYDFWNAENSAYFCDQPGLTTSQLRGHAVTIVGWDDNYSRENFGTVLPGEITVNDDGEIIEGEPVISHQPENDGAWLCKNSWGSSWSNMGGYFWISYEDLYLFEKRFGPSYAIMDLEQYSESNHLYQNEIYGATYEFDYTPATEPPTRTITYINVFDFEDRYNELDKIIFESTSVGSGYELFYIPVDEDGVPREDEALWTPLGTGSVDYRGYLNVDIDNLTVPRGKGAIGVRITSADDETPPSLGTCEWLTVGNNRLIFRPEVQRGSCYVIGFGSKIMDLTDFYSTYLDDDLGSTFVIKAVANIIDVMGDVDGDGLLTILDATVIQRKLADLVEFNEKQEALADYDGDGEVTILDCTKIQRVLAELDEPLYPMYT